MTETVIEFDADRVEINDFNSGEAEIVIYPDGSDDPVVAYQRLIDPLLELMDDHEDIDFSMMEYFDR